jgi:sugar lactone lactonase YvrE
MKILLVSIALVLFSNYSNSQWVSTVYDPSGMQITDAIIMDSDGNMYGSDYNGSSVFKVTNGVASVFATGFNAPNGLAFDSQGNLFVCDNTGGNIYKIDPTGVFLDTFAVQSPSGILKEYDSDTMIVTGYTTHKIWKLAPDGTLIETHSGTPLNGPVGLAQDENGQVYVANFNNRIIFKVFPDSVQYLATMPGTTNSYLGFIEYAHNEIWATSFQTDKLYTFNPNYMDSVTAVYGSIQGTQDGFIDQARFSNPNGIWASVTEDTIYVSDYNTGKIRMIQPETLASTDLSLDDGAFIYPNPAKDEIRVIVDPETEDPLIKITDHLGRLLIDVQKISLGKPIDISSLDPGVYFITITINGVHEIHQLVKE